jgi:hypothetical protein
MSDDSYEIRCPACGLVVSVSGSFLVSPHVSGGKRCTFKRGRPGEIRSLHAELAYEIFTIKRKFGIKEPLANERVKKANTGKRGGKKKKKYAISHSFMDRSGASWREVSGGAPGLGKHN